MVDDENDPLFPKTNPLWTEELTRKAQYFKKLIPILEVEKIQFRDENKVQIFNHYPRIEIFLKIVDIILGRTSIIGDNPYTGITREQIFREIQRFLKKIDQFYNKIVPTTDHWEFFIKIWDCIVPPSKKTHILNWTDFSCLPFKDSGEPFQYLQPERTPDNVVLYTIDPLLINVYAKILDIKLEDQQEALKYILSKKIKEGKYGEAIAIAEKDLEITKQYVFKIHQIKNTIERNFNSPQLYDEYREQLKVAREHIQSCRTHCESQLNDLSTVLLQMKFLENRDKDQIQLLKAMIDKSIAKIIEIQLLITFTRNTYLERQPPFTFHSGKIEFSKISNITKGILEASLSMKEEILQNLLPYFTRPVCPRLLTVAKMIDLKIKAIRLETKGRTKRRRTSPNKNTNPLRRVIFPDELKTRVINYLNQITTEEREVSLEAIMQRLEKQDIPHLFQDYLRLVVQISVAFPNVNLGMRDINLFLITTPLPRRFTSKNYVGDELILSKKMQSKEGMVNGRFKTRGIKSKD